MKLRSLVAGAALATLALTGCGTTDAPTTEDTASAASGEKITVKDMNGEDVTLDGPASKVVTLEWSVTEYVTSLGVQPIGAADVKGYNTWSQVNPLEDDVKDVGVRTEPSVDSIAGLEPDLIIADVSSIPEDAMEQMKKIAPVLVLNSASTTDLLDLVKSNQETVAQALGKEDAYTQVAEEYDTTIADAKKKIDDAGLQDTPVAYVYPTAEANNISFRVHGPGSTPAVVAESIDLANASTTEGDEAYGISQADLESLGDLPEDTRFFNWYDPTTEDPMTVLEKNPVWNDLDFVKADHVYTAKAGIWPYGGLDSMGAIATDFADQLAG